jgi:integrase/recombinase XerD
MKLSSTKTPLCYPIEQWPADDQKAWSKACEPVSLFGDEGDGLQHLAEITRRHYAFGWGRWITFLSLHAPHDLELSPAKRCTKANVQAYVEDLRAKGNAESTVISRLQELVNVASVLDQLFDPRLINRFIAELKAKAKPARSKAHIPSADVIVELGFHLMASVSDICELEDATTYRDGLIIAFLALHPVRLRNLTHFHLDTNLIQQNGGYVVVFQSSETKTGSVYEVPLADVLVEPMRKYLTECRPVLVSANGRHKHSVGTGIWVSGHGSPMSSTALRDHIKMRTRLAFGKSIHPHAFRDAAATTMVVVDPSRVRSAAAVLGHRSFATTEAYYVRAKGLEAQRSHLENLEALKKERSRG